MSATIAKGDISRSRVMSRLVETKDQVLMPWSEDCRYDLVFEEHGDFKRVQVKTGKMTSGSIRFNTCSTYKLSGKQVRKSYTAEEIDFFGVFCPDTDTVYLVPIDSVGIKEASLRVDACGKNNAGKQSIRWACDYVL